MMEFTESATFAQLLSIGLELLFFVNLLIFTLYTLFLAYHWFSYGTSRSVSLFSLAIFLIGSAPLLIVMSVTF